ncbi:heavy-metal-associated domain-containing protein [Streptomyces sp. NPDC089424]|uniref:heavy-metal-associated domain-containing protein n=1 Tax=Streptomyces sp. NPDC089424 TaxID=3365917 RepID=UPI0037F78F9D
MSCCTPDSSCSTDGRTTVYNVSGMTCGHCKATLTKETGALEGVGAVNVDLEAGQVSVTTSGQADDMLLARVVDDAGYELTGRVS